MPFPEFFLLVFYLKRSMVKVQLGAVNSVMLFTNFAHPPPLFHHSNCWRSISKMEFLTFLQCILIFKKGAIENTSINPIYRPEHLSYFSKVAGIWIQQYFLKLIRTAWLQLWLPIAPIIFFRVRSAINIVAGCIGAPLVLADYKE